jgi:integrase
MVFKFAIATGRATRDISVDLRGALITPRVKHRAAIIAPSEIGALLRAIDGFDGHPQTKAALQIAPHVFVRPSELRCSEWSEFDFEGRVWAIPAERMKMKRPHRVPLSRQVIATLGVFAQDRRSWKVSVSIDTLDSSTVERKYPERRS